jgi:site-specific DNA recombinase
MINYGSRYKRANGEESYYSTYVCGYWNNHKKGKCRKNPIKTEILEKAVIGGLREYTRRPNLAEEIHQYMEQELDTGKLEKETEELKNKIAALDKNEDMQYKILCQIGVNPTYQNMKPERIQINLDKIATEKKELQEKLDYKMKQIESVQLEKMDFELVKNLLENFNEVYEDAPKELRKRLVRSLIKEVQLGYDDKGKVVPVKMILKFSGEQIELMKEHKENFGLNEAHAEEIVVAELLYIN